MLKVKLRHAMAEYERTTGRRTTYAEIAEATGLSKATLEALGSRSDYNTTLATVDLLCRYLRCDLTTLLEHIPGEHVREDVNADKN